MSEQEKLHQERRLENILKSNLSPTAKVRSIVSLGFTDAVARITVAQVSQHQFAYYERIGPIVHGR